MCKFASSVLKGEIAEQQSVYIMRAFREMRHYIIENQQIVNNPQMISMLINQTNSNTKDIKSLQNRVKEISNYFVDELKMREYTF